MLPVIFLVFTVIIVAIGAFCGFRRGIIKEGVRIALWGVLFAGSCFFIPKLAESLPLMLAGNFGITAVDMEQLVAELLKKSEIFRKDTYLILPLAGFVRTLILPFITIVFFWASGLVSFILYLIASLFLRKATENQKLASRLAGLVFGIVISLIGGAVTLYPMAAASSAVQEGDSDRTLCEEFAPVKSVAEAYEGTLVSYVYRFTGTEFLGNAIHNAINTSVVSEENHNIWNALPKLVNVVSEGWQIYDAATEETAEQSLLQEHVQKTLEAYFSLDFVSDENKILLLKRLKATMEASFDDDMISTIAGWINIQTAEQLTKDATAYAYVYDVLKQEGILDVVLNSADMPELSEETGTAITTTLYELSNAEVVVPEAINLIYSAVMSGAEKELVRTENIEWNEETKEDISEVVSVICKLSSVVGQDELTLEEKKTALDAIKALKDNEAVGKENYAALLKAIMGML